MELINATEFFSTARERYQIKLRREFDNPAYVDQLGSSAAKKIWTFDAHFRDWRFCNVHREDDRTTVWFRENIREPLNQIIRSKGVFAQASIIEAVQATIIFRWFNRIETGEIIKDLLLGEWNTEEARRRLVNVHPVVTGAYIIKGPDGMSKLDGVLHCIDAARETLPSVVARWGNLPKDRRTLRLVWEDLKEFYYLGGFMSYEVVSDLRWTPLLETAPDITTWANAGPGCARGLWWVTGQKRAFAPGSRKDQEEMLELMRELLMLSREPRHWPSAWKQWEMREVEHWCCEYDKYRRAKAGLRLKRRFQ